MYYVLIILQNYFVHFDSFIIILKLSYALSNVSDKPLRHREGRL